MNNFWWSFSLIFLSNFFMIVLYITHFIFITLFEYWKKWKLFLSQTNENFTFKVWKVYLDRNENYVSNRVELFRLSKSRVALIFASWRKQWNAPPKDFLVHFLTHYHEEKLTLVVQTFNREYLSVHYIMHYMHV